ncbi:50S ribosomal protein L31 [candidate division WWE3 bacterium CG08_land_8_20_14_0_20_40_13]|uniref:Large ribosomal subunit protein bL31 n=1 Tax=candidate division WWE3 bacterium CG08_land_8_20_14_0_20_40_13 TaxID=1975084 RepID=A0A2H0XD75_UNCKA|nr:MAG: 50S ribosomal protein L31 [candidate division WWE3 bacterium CG08_land_8_20_14_0_20_40_13]
MKQNIHPKYYSDCKVICACGNTFVTGSIIPEIKVEVCGACHPFYTGKEKFVDTEGRVERFQRKVEVARKAQEIKKVKVAEKVEKRQVATNVKSLKDLLKDAGR